MASVIKTGMLYRTLEWDRQAIDTEKRTVPLSFSSETPVFRTFGVRKGWEILDHSPGAVDMSRSRLPLLMDHNKSNQVGKVDIAITGKRGIGIAKFSKSSAAIMEDVTEDIRGDTSVGYAIDEMVEEGEKDGYPIFRATKWRPLEISLVSVPADPTVGVGRSQSVDENQFETRIEDTKLMANPTDIPAVPVPGYQQAPPAPTPALQVRQDDIPDHLLGEDVRQIRATAKHYKGQIEGIEELARYAEFSGMTMLQFRQKITAQLEADIAKKQALKPTPLGEDLKPSDLKNYSLTRAICSQLPGGGGISGFEREMSQEVSRRYRSTPEGFWVPPEILVANMQRSFVAGTGTLGGFLVQTTNLGQDFIEVLRNLAQVMRLGARTLQLDTPVTIPRQAAQGTTNWVGETVISTLSVGNFDQITLTPRGISANQQYAKQLLVTNNPSIDALVRDDILKIIALAIDLAALHGSGSPQPTGIIGTTGIGSAALSTNGQILANSTTTVYPAMVSLETLVSAANADRGALAYLMRSAHRGALRVSNRFSSTDSPVWTNGGPYPAGIGAGLGDGASDGIVNGYRAAVTNQIATNLTTGTATTITSALFFGNWNELLIGQFNGGATDLVVDPYTAGANAVVRLYARHWIDIGVRHGASFAVLGGIL